jgi:hypothetical protein
MFDKCDEGPTLPVPYGMARHPGYHQLKTAAAHMVLLHNAR